MVAEINIPNNVIDHYNEINKINKNVIIALLYYKEYADGNKTLGNIVDDLNNDLRNLENMF